MSDNVYMEAYYGKLTEFEEIERCFGEIQKKARKEGYNSNPNKYPETKKIEKLFAKVFGLKKAIFYWVPSNVINAYTITVYGTKDSCEGIELRSLNLITPKYNTYSDYSFCKEYPNFDYCKEYVVDDSFNLEDFINKSAAYKEAQDSKNSKDNQKDKNNKSNFFKENKKLLIICGSIILIVGVTTTVIIIIRKRSRLI